MNRHKALRLVAALAVVTVVLLVGRRRAAAGDEPALLASGTIEATELDLAAETAGTIAQLLVDEGQRVRLGEPVAVLDHGVLEAELARAEAAARTAAARLADVTAGTRAEILRAKAAQLDEALAALATARRMATTARAAYRRPTELTASVDATASQLRQAEARLAEARARLAEADHGPRPEELAQAREAVRAADEAVAAATAAREQADRALAGARAELSQIELADRQRQAADSQVAVAETRVLAAEQTLAAATARREQVLAPPRPDLRAQAQRRLESARTALELADSELTRDRQLFAAGAIAERRLETTQARREQAAAAVAEVEAALADLDAGAREPERREVEAAVARAEVELAGTRRDLENARREQAIVRAGSRQGLERAQSAVTQAEAGVSGAAARVAGAEAQRDQAQAALRLLEAGTREERLAQAAAAVEQAEAHRLGALAAARHARQAEADRFALRQQLEAGEGQVAAALARVQMARAELDLALHGPTPNQVKLVEGELAQAEAARQVVGEHLERTILRAPRAGTISRIILREGEAVTPGSVVVQLLDLDRLWVRVYVGTRWFPRIVRGQAVQVTADAWPDRPYPGRVLTVADEAEFTPKNTQTTDERVKNVFWVKIDVGDGRGELKPGLPVDVTFPGVTP